MNPSQHWVQLVNETMAQQSVPYDQAWIIASRTHQDAATLMRAFGQPRQAVSFFNSKQTAAQPAKIKAREEFREKVHQRMAFANCDYDTAYRFVSKYDVQLANEANGLTAKTSFINAGGVPVFGPQLKAMLHLPMDADQEMCSAAWKGNGEAASPFNPGKIFAALCDLLQQRTGSSYETAIATAKSRFPELWKAVAEISKQVA